MLKVSNFSRLSTALHLYLKSNNYFVAVRNMSIVVSIVLSSLATRITACPFFSGFANLRPFDFENMSV